MPFVLVTPPASSNTIINHFFFYCRVDRDNLNDPDALSGVCLKTTSNMDRAVRSASQSNAGKIKQLQKISSEQSRFDIGQ